MTSFSRSALHPSELSHLKRTRKRVGALGLALAVALALSAPAARASDVKVTDEARKHFNAGVALLRDPDGARYEEAYREFKVAYEASPSWKILGNLGIAAMKLERDGEAIAAFERYLAEGKKDLDAAEKADVERDLATLRASAVSLALTSTVGELSILDERTPVQGSPIRNRYQSDGGTLRLQIRPGHHVITASTDGKPVQTWELDAEPGSSHEHQFDFEAAEVAPVAGGTSAQPVSSAPVAASRERPIPTGVWVGAAATGALAIGAGVVGVLALGKNSEYQDANGKDAGRARSLRDETNTLNLVTDVLLAAAVVGAGVTTYFYLKRPERQTDALELRFGPRLGVNDAGLELKGAF